MIISVIARIVLWEWGNDIDGRYSRDSKGEYTPLLPKDCPKCRSENINEVVIDSSRSEIDHDLPPDSYSYWLCSNCRWAWGMDIEPHYEKDDDLLRFVQEK